MAGRLIAVVGPSGVGKDSVIDALSVRRTDLTVVRRTITRPVGLGGEDYEPVSEAEFARRLDAGAFCLNWRAHGLSYGIPVSVRQRVTAGGDMLVNLSRGVLADARQAFPLLVVVHLTARPETLAARLRNRGRENGPAIAGRLTRSGLTMPPGIPAIEISNDGALTVTVDRALAALYPVRV